MILKFIFSLLVGAVIGSTIVRIFQKRKRRRKLAALNKLEASLPTEVPETCPKCGYAGRAAKNTRTGRHSLPARSAFGKPHYIGRLTTIDSPEHLFSMCHECNFKFMTSAKGHTHG